jgi:hypothetical protein
MSDPRERLFRKSDKAPAKECGIAWDNDADAVHYRVSTSRPEPAVHRSRI